MATINVKCTGCKDIHAVRRTEEIPNEVVSLECNWCPKCDDSAQDYYMEKYIYEEEHHFNPDQLSIF